MQILVNYIMRINCTAKSDTELHNFVFVRDEKKWEKSAATAVLSVAHQLNAENDQFFLLKYEN